MVLDHVRCHGDDVSSFAHAALEVRESGSWKRAASVREGSCFWTPEFVVIAFRISNLEVHEKVIMQLF